MSDTTVGVNVHAVNSSVNVHISVGDYGASTYTPSYATGQDVAQIVGGVVGFSALLFVGWLAVRAVGLLSVVAGWAGSALVLLVEALPAIATAVTALLVSVGVIGALGIAGYLVAPLIPQAARLWRLREEQRKPVQLLEAAPVVHVLEDKQAQETPEYIEFVRREYARIGTESWTGEIEASTPGILEFVGAFNRKGGIGLVETVGPPKITRS